MRNVKIDEAAAEHAVTELLHAFGIDPAEDQGMRDTPHRVARAFAEMLSGYAKTAEQVLGTTFEAEGYDDIVLLKGIEFSSLCEHHMLPFIGTADFAYLPNEKIVGISKLARLVEMHARRLQVQERLANDVVNDFVRIIKPRGVALVLTAHHECMGCRGAKQPRVTMTTSKMVGVFRENPSAREEILALITR